MQQLELTFGETERNWNSYVVAASTVTQSFQDWLEELSIMDAELDAWIDQAIYDSFN